MKVSNDTNRGRDLREDTKSRIESEDEVKSYIQNLKYALDNGARITFQAKRMVDLVGLYGSPTTFVMSFHFAERAFTSDMFPYKKK